jgi:uncharacterized protein (TIGR03382 family)
MLGSIRRRAALSAFAALVACGMTAAANAGKINIILSDMDVSYTGASNGGVFFDSMGGVNGGGKDPTFADDISTAVFELDSSVVGTLINTGSTTDDLFGDLRLINVGATLAKNVLIPSVGNNGGGFGFGFFSDTGLMLSLGMTNASVLISDGVFFFTGQASILPGQNLPFGLVFDESQPVQFSYTATLPAVQAGATTNMAMASGALTISGIAIPEPAAITLAFASLVSLGAALHRRRVRRD